MNIPVWPKYEVTFLFCMDGPVLVYLMFFALYNVIGKGKTESWVDCAWRGYF